MAIVEGTEHTDIDVLIEEEKRRVALDFFKEAWDTASAEGIEADILVETAIFTALSEFTKSDGEDMTSEFVASLCDRVACGEFSPSRTVQ